MPWLKRIFFLLTLVLGTAVQMQAQLCQGSLGDPIVNISFGAGANPGAPLKAATTTYRYVSNDCPSDGFYTVRSNTTGCFGSTWHTLNGDHTGDPNGYFMLVNASVQPSAFYLDTVRGLCGGTTYEFAAWVMNVLKQTACTPNPTQPNLTFTIEATDGTVLRTYNTNTIGSTPGPLWQQFGFFFTTPSSTSDIVLRIFNNAPGGCGNDLALDDITFRPCGPQLDASFAGNNNQSITICEGDTRSFEFNCTVSAGFNDPSFQWQQSSDGINWTDIPGAQAVSFARFFNATVAPGSYFFRMSAAESGNMGSVNCRIASNSLSVKVAANPVPSVSSNSPVCEQTVINLQAGGGAVFSWTGVNGFIASGADVAIGNAQMGMAGKYFVTVTSDEGCQAIDSVAIEVNPAPQVSVGFGDTTICLGEAVQLVANGGSSYLWSPGSTLSSINTPMTVATPLLNQDYTVIAFNDFQCADTAFVSVQVVDTPSADAGPDRWVIEGSSVMLKGSATGQDISHEWSPGLYLDNPFLLQPLITPFSDTRYVLTVVSNAGCGADSDTMRVFVYKDVFVPGAFSPNNDGLNDTWNIPVLIAYPDFELMVFNRQGRMVYQSRQSYEPWDGSYRGEPQPAGVYVYMIDLKDGSPVRKGTITLIR